MMTAGSHGSDVSRKFAHSRKNAEYWWTTTGYEIANMMNVAGYPVNTQQAFLSYYRDHVCPLLGGIPDIRNPHQAKSWTWDGSTHEYSFELTKREINRPEVRFVLDASRLRPVDAAKPLNPLPTDVLIETFADRAPGFDDTWYRSLKRYFDYSYLPAKEQHSLATEAGHLSPILIGFDIARELLSHTVLPIRGKAYFLPCFAAVAEKTTRFASICTAIRTLPAIDSYPSILTGLAAIETYLATKPADWSNGARYLSTDFLSPDKARLKIYLRCPSISFDDIWDYFTLGGRIPGLDEDREKYLDFIKFLGGTTPGDFGNTSDSHAIETDNRRKLTTLYFSLDNRYPVPSPKVAFCARNFAANDAVVAHGLDSWLMKYGWTDKGGTSVEDQVANVFTHRALSEKPGIFTFMGLARKDPATRELSIQTYMCPELYESPKRLEVAEDIEDRKSGDRNLA